MANELNRSTYLSRNVGDFPAETVIAGRRYVKVDDLRYGTNPHQPAAYYKPADETCVIGDMEIDPEKRPDCHRLFNACKNKYVLDLNDDRVFDTAFSMPVLPQTNSTIINAVNKLQNEEKKSRLTTLKETFYQSKNNKHLWF